MQEAAATGNEQQKIDRAIEIRKRAKYITFDDPRIRGANYQYHNDFNTLLMESWATNPDKSEYLNRNPDLSNLPERWFASLHRPWHPQSPEAFLEREVENTEDLADEALREALDGWSKDQRAEQLKEAIETIENPEAIKKIVCIALGVIIIPGGRVGRPRIADSALAQHAAAIKIAEQLKQLTGRDVPIYAVEPGYLEGHKLALEKRNITVLDLSYERQEHFCEIDDSTIVIAITGLIAPYLKDLIFEYARPAAFITERPKIDDYPLDEPFSPDTNENDEYDFRARDFQWYEMYKGPQTGEASGIREKIAVPGKPTGIESSKTMKILEQEYELVESFPISREGVHEPWHLYHEHDESRLGRCPSYDFATESWAPR
ncbi:hypothetical protein HD806DRAFT_258406 [Xylariaceae sp. AK1471]|nr:hypothetical protein HD806DRAFT_258406 [Xylariaceae sp. AK1471]